MLYSLGPLGLTKRVETSECPIRSQYLLQLYSNIIRMSQICILIIIGPGFTKLLQYQQQRHSHCIEDMYDGTLYRRLLKPRGPLSIEGNISLTLNTDGVDDIFHSTTYSLWPVFLSINELSPSQRYIKFFTIGGVGSKGWAASLRKSHKTILHYIIAQRT